MVDWTRNKIIGTAVTLLVSAIVAPLLLYEYTNRPIIDYQLEDTEYLNFGFGPETVTLDIQNRGGIDARVWLILETVNATIVEPETKPFIEYNQTQTRILLFCKKDSDTMNRGYSLEILPDGDPQTIVISYRVEKLFNFDSLFCDINPIYPCILNYNKTATMTYKKAS